MSRFSFFSFFFYILNVFSSCNRFIGRLRPVVTLTLFSVRVYQVGSEPQAPLHSHENDPDIAHIDYHESLFIL